ncbi:hypothetical protein SAVIM40S_07653 [Streptomyces avidinii]
MTRRPQPGAVGSRSRTWRRSRALSRTRSTRRSARSERCSATRSAVSAGSCAGVTPRARRRSPRTWWGSAGRASIPRRSAKNTPSGKLAATSCATRTATAVLPTPPIPLIAPSAATGPFSRACRSRAISASRPTRSAVSGGRLSVGDTRAVGAGTDTGAAAAAGAGTGAAGRPPRERDCRGRVLSGTGGGGPAFAGPLTGPGRPSSPVPVPVPVRTPVPASGPARMSRRIRSSSAPGSQPPDRPNRRTAQGLTGPRVNLQGLGLTSVSYRADIRSSWSRTRCSRGRASTRSSSTARAWPPSSSATSHLASSAASRCSTSAPRWAAANGPGTPARGTPSQSASAESYSASASPGLPASTARAALPARRSKTVRTRASGSRCRA